MLKFKLGCYKYKGLVGAVTSGATTTIRGGWAQPQVTDKIDTTSTLSITTLAAYDN